VTDDGPVGFVGWMILIGIVVIVVSIIAFVIRMRSGEEMVAGGSAGSQVFGHEDTSWGPTSTPWGHARDEPHE
jgi:hypothetical protein